MKAPAPERILIAGVPFDCCTGEQALAIAQDAMRRQDGYLSVVTPNAVIAGKCVRDPSLGRMLRRADLCLADGEGVLLGARLAARSMAGSAKARKPSGGRRFADAPSFGDADPLLCERVAGIDFARGVLLIAARSGLPVYFLGARPGIAEEAARKLMQELPGLKVCGWRDGYFGENETGSVLSDIRASGAVILFVCLGFPRQEQFILRHSDSLPGIRLAAGLGGSFDVWARAVKRAPVWMQRTGMEWLWRTVREPRRIPELGNALRFLCSAARKGTVKEAEQQPAKPDI